MKTIENFNPSVIALLLGCALVFSACDDDNTDSENPGGNGVRPP